MAKKDTALKPFKINSMKKKIIAFVAFTFGINAIFAQSGTTIIGGQTIQITDAPYQVSLLKDGVHWCGGTIISNSWIMTAAHCFQAGGGDLNLNNATVQAGTNESGSSNGQVININAIHIHPNYSYNPYMDNDIALIHLSNSLVFNENVIPIEYANSCNTSPNKISPGEDVYVSGWGKVCNTCSGAQFLQGLSIPIIDNAFAYALNIASNSTRADFLITNDMLSFYQLGTGVGPGDSGGPSVIDINGNIINVGVSSWGFSPYDQLPTIYTNVRNYSSWIESTTGFSIGGSGVDLYTKDRPWDMGDEPSDVDFPWMSEDIWVRNQNDGLVNQVHQNPEYFANPGNHNYVYVRVRNRGCVASSGNEKLKLYWAKASTAMAWPNHWNGSMSVGGQSLGDFVDEVSLPVIEPGDAHIAVFTWNAPNPANYAGLSSDPIFWAEEPHHFCLLSRIEAINDPMSAIETVNLGDNVLKNNNISWKNLTIVDLDPTNLVAGGEIKNGGSVLVGNVEDTETAYDFVFKTPEYFLGNTILNEAEIYLKLDVPLYLKWEEGGFLGEGIEIVEPDEQLIQITSEPATIKGISLGVGDYLLMHLSFNFLTQDVTNQNKYVYSVTQNYVSNNDLVGGEIFEVYKSHRALFYANAGADIEINKFENTLLSAHIISEDATYNWFNEAGELIHTGVDVQLAPLLTEEFTLEVIADLDGFKDYDEVNVNVKTSFINDVHPNPTNSSSQVTVQYYAGDANYSELLLVPLFGGATIQYSLDTQETEILLDVSSLSLGQYAVVLKCDGVITDYSNFINN